MLVSLIASWAELAAGRALHRWKRLFEEKVVLKYCGRSAGHGRSRAVLVKNDILPELGDRLSQLRLAVGFGDARLIADKVYKEV